MLWLLLPLLVLRLGAQQNSQLLTFDQTGWVAPEAGRHYQMELVTAGCVKSQTCLQMTPGPESSDRYGIYEKRIPAEALRGKTILFSVTLHVALGARAAIQVRVETSAGGVLFRNDTLLQAIQGRGDWTGAMLPAEISPLAETLVFGILAREGRVVAAPVSVVQPFAARAPKEMNEPSSRLNRTALNNLMSFARLYGEVRYGHPSDAAAEADWFAFVVSGVRTLDYATMAASLGRRMQELFAPVAPGVAIYVGSPPEAGPELSPSGKQELVRWEHRLEADGVHSERKVEPLRAATVAEVRTVNLGRDLWARVPTVLFREDGRTLPRVRQITARREPTVITNYSGDDRPTRLSNVIVLWNLLRRFHPLAGQRQIDWDDMLARAMQQAAEDEDKVAFARTLQAMLARVDDQQEVVGYEAADREGYLPITARWEGGRLVTPTGDAILGINGKSIAVLRMEAELYGERAWAELWPRGSLDLEVPVRMAVENGEKTVVMRYVARKGGPPAQTRSGVCQFVLPGGYSIVWPLAGRP
jgi:hypothetical protein